jgi:hypothetical protein
VYDLDITGFLNIVTDEMRELSPALRVFESDYAGAIPHLRDDVKKTFETIEYLYSKDDISYLATDCLENIGERNKEKAAELYTFGKVNGAIKYERFLPILLIHLYPIEKSKYYQEVIELYNQNAVQGLIALSFLKYDTSDEIEKVFDFIVKNKAPELDYLRQLPSLLCRLIENSSTPETVRTLCFAEIKELLKVDDEQLKGNLLMRFQIINGFEREKMERRFSQSIGGPLN